MSSPSTIQWESARCGRSHISIRWFLLASEPGTLEIIHVRSSDEILRCLHISTAHSPAPMRPVIFAQRLKYIFFVRDVSRDCPADVADWDSEYAFP